MSECAGPGCDHPEHVQQPPQRPRTSAELAELVAQVHPGLNRHDRRAEARRLLRQARRSLREQARAGRGGEGA